MVGLQQYFEMIWGSVGHGIGAFLCSTFMVVVMTPFLVDILLSFGGVHLHLTEKSLHFWGKWFIAWPVKTVWSVITFPFKKKKKKHNNH